MKSQAKIIGRSTEKALLENILHSERAEFLAVYGRRRVGKTYLIRTFFKNEKCVFFNAIGIKKANMAQQIEAFMKEIEQVFYEGIKLKNVANWFEALEQLERALQKNKRKKIVLFFDEFPWMATPRSQLVTALDFYWNRYFSQNNGVKLVICGSAASWIIKNIINDKGGLHNRLTHTISLEPFNLSETYAFLKSQGCKLNYAHVTEIYMAMGGIPYYLSHVSAGSSSSQVIQALGFVKNSFFVQEFDNLYASLFDDAEVYIEIVRAMATKKSGMNQRELMDVMSLNITKGGTLVNKLKALEQTGFITSFIPYQHSKKGVFYRVIDEYTLFYFHWIEPVKSMIQLKGLRKGYWQSIQQSPNFYNWAGYAFEAICFKHLAQISAALNLSPIALPSSWRYMPIRSTEEGAQIDLLFDREDGAITFCEIKYTRTPFNLEKSYAATLYKKMDVFKKVTRVNKQYFLALISANGLKKTLHAQMIDAVVTLDDLFIEEML